MSSKLFLRRKPEDEEGNHYDDHHHYIWIKCSSQRSIWFKYNHPFNTEPMVRCLIYDISLRFQWCASFHRRALSCEPKKLGIQCWGIATLTELTVTLSTFGFSADEQEKLNFRFIIFLKGFFFRFFKKNLSKSDEMKMKKMIYLVRGETKVQS